ncbi:MAG: GNAT family N-acetyltransferase [Myxococcota bacterium]
MSAAPQTTLSVEIVEDLDEVDEAEWDVLLGDGDDASPFLEWRFLVSLQRAGTLGIENGWVPRFPLLRQEGRLVAAAPAYIKLHSQGEFVFDFAWANFAERVGVSYYPKLLVGVPFTPVTGRRILTAQGEDRPFLIKAMGQVLAELCTHFDLSSVHVNFATEEEVTLLQEMGYLHRLGIQYHWYRNGEGCFDDYLARFNSKRRNQLKRERRALEKEDVHVECIGGQDFTPELTDIAFRIYKSTVDKFYWGRQYLNRRVFELWAEMLPERLELVAARAGADGPIIAGAVNFAKNRRLYGRYWGCFKDVKHLHFNVCYYEGIHRAYSGGFDIFEPGAGGEHKLVRGFQPTLMNSAHYIRSDRLAGPIAQYLASERQQIQLEQEAMLSSMGQKQS